VNLDNKAYLLKILRQRKATFFSGEKIAQELGVTRAAVWKIIKELNENGYQIEGIKKRGYRLLQTPDALFSYEIQSYLQTRYLGQKIHFFEVCDSTNQVAKKLAANGAPEGTLVIAEEQTGGRGRLNRSWFSPPGGLWFSLILRPQISPGEVFIFNLAAAISIVAILEEQGLKGEIKWPNDINIEGKKVAGILLEVATQPDVVEYLVIGIGINVNIDQALFPVEIREHATSLSQILGTKLSRASILADLLLELEATYEAIKKGEKKRVIKTWKRYCTTLGRWVKLKTIRRTVIGYAEDIDANGSLVIRLANGVRVSYRSGDVTVLSSS
jgi:BirA family biotin operon repressor/biotin-[acetyl-CoA-carboxylase] ligase